MCDQQNYCNIIYSNCFNTIAKNVSYIYICYNTNLVLLRLGLAERCGKASIPIGDLHESPQSLRTQKFSLPIGDDPNLRMAWKWTSNFVCIHMFSTEKGLFLFLHPRSANVKIRCVHWVMGFQWFSHFAGAQGYCLGTWGAHKQGSCSHHATWFWPNGYCHGCNLSNGSASHA